MGKSTEILKCSGAIEAVLNIYNIESAPAKAIRGNLKRLDAVAYHLMKEELAQNGTKEPIHE